MTASLAATHSNYSPDFWTPPEWWEWIYESFGTRDVFDPCPDDWQPGDPSGLEIDWPISRIPWRPGYVNRPGRVGTAQDWWLKYQTATGVADWWNVPIIWCCFKAEHLRMMRLSPLELPGTLVMPRDRRVSFIWGGPTYQPERGAPRVHGEPLKSPANCTVFWASPSVTVAPPPVESIVVPTGVGR